MADMKHTLICLYPQGGSACSQHTREFAEEHYYWCKIGYTKDILALSSTNGIKPDLESDTEIDMSLIRIGVHVLCLAYCSWLYVACSNS